MHAAAVPPSARKEAKGQLAVKAAASWSNAAHTEDVPLHWLFTVGGQHPAELCGAEVSLSASR